jgi:hypothetical protein
VSWLTFLSFDVFAACDMWGTTSFFVVVGAEYGHTNAATAICRLRKGLTYGVTPYLDMVFLISSGCSAVRIVLLGFAWDRS